MASFYFHQAEIRISTSVLIVSITVNPARPRWVTLVSILNLVLLIMILGLVALKYADSLGGSFVGVPDFERRIVEVESFMMQVQTEFMNKTIESSEVGGLRREKEKENAGEVNHRFEKLSEMLEKKLGTVEFLRKEDFDKIFDDLMNVKGADIGDREVSLDEIRMVARDMLVKEMQRHASDGLGRVDYALSSGGAKVVRHSEPFIIGKVRRWFRKISPTTVYRDSEKMLKPSFGQPGQCFPLKGDSGFVQIRLGTTINPEAITLEHVDKVMFMLFYVILSNSALLFYDMNNPIYLMSSVCKMLIDMYLSILRFSYPCLAFMKQMDGLSTEILYTFTI